MLIIPKILANDAHHSRDSGKISLCIETLARPEWLPAIISNSHGKFHQVDKLFKSGELQHRILNPGIPFTPQDKSNDYLISGVFKHNSDKIDDILPDLFEAAYDLSKKLKWPNIFTGKDAAGRAFNYVKANGPPDYPQICLFPKDAIKKKDAFLGKKKTSKYIYEKNCRITPCKIQRVVFLSRPDMVGLYTQILGDHSSIFLHNIKLGMAFCPL